MRQIGDHALVLGAGMAGLTTARVLADAYDRVTLIERDALSPTGAARRGVPQGRHAHVLMPRGTQLLDELCPGLVQQLMDDGATLAEPLVDFRFRVGGHLLRQTPVGTYAVQASRPFLEDHLRDRVRGLPGVDVVDNCDVVGLVTAEIREQVGGVRIMRRAAGSAEETVSADLVVDATGRASRTPVWLAGLGYDRPAEDQPRVDVGYASQCLRLADDAIGIEKTVGIGPVPGLPRGMILTAVEGGRHILTVTGFGAAHRPPTEPDRFLDFVGTVAPTDVFAAILAAEPLGPIAAYRFPHYLRRHYERMRRFPSGLLVIGDALCCFSPIYAQGMTVAAQQALALRDCLVHGDQQLARRFFRAAAGVVADPWRAAIGADLALPEIEGHRPVSVRLVNRYVDRVLSAAESDDVVARQFMRVMGLLDPASALFRPGMVRRVLHPRARQVDELAPAVAGRVGPLGRTNR